MFKSLVDVQKSADVQKSSDVQKSANSCLSTMSFYAGTAFGRRIRGYGSGLEHYDYDVKIIKVMEENLIF